MRITRAIVLVAVGLSMLSAAACASTQRPTRAATKAGSPTNVAVNLPTKDELAKEYLAASTAYNDVWRTCRAEIEAGTTLTRARGIGSDMATANWTAIEKARAMRASIEVPGDYPTDKAFYTDLHTTLGQHIDKKLRLQEMWTRMRDATTVSEWEKALDDPVYKDDGVTQRRLRSLLGLPDTPTS